MNKLLQAQLRKYLDEAGQLPENFSELLNAISNSYDHYEKEQKITERAIELRSKKMIELNSQLKKEKEKELEESVSMLEATIESTADGILVADFNGKMVRFNKKFIELWRIPQGILDARDDEKAIAFVLDQLTNPEEFVAKVKELYVHQKEVSFDILKFKDGRTFERYSQPQLINGNCVGRVWSFRDITDRKKTEDIIRESEMRYRSLIEQATDAICIADSSMKLFEMNPSACRLLGYSKEEVLHLSVTDLFLAEDLRAQPFEIVKLKSGQTISNERRFKRKDGTLVEVEINAQVLADGRFIVFGRDISERKQAEKLLKESELRNRNIIEQATDAICIADTDMKFIDVNSYACGFLGYTKEEALQLSVADVLFTEDLASNPFKYYDAQPNKIIRNERRFKRKDGSSVTMEVSTRLTEDGRFIMFGHDVSERKKSEEALKESENQLSIATRIAKLGYWEFDIMKGLFTFNDQFYSVFKTTAEAVGGYTMAPDRYAELFVYPDDREVVGTEVGNAINSPDPHFSRQIEHRIMYATGEIGWISVHYYIVKNKEGLTIKTFGVNQDITERKKTEETLRTSEINLEIKNKELKEKNIELEQFAYIASHDLQEPLRTTSSFVGLIQKQYKGQLDERADKYFNYILDASERMKVLIKNLLDYSRIGSKKELEKVDCNVLIKNVMADLHVAIQEAKANITVVDLPEVCGYSTEFKQLFQNLLLNAIKFRKPDTIPQVLISAQKLNNNWEFTFKDNGIGIEEKHREKIFDIFQRLHSRTEYEGSGIGLSYCKKIVELHKGKIWVESEPGIGSTFHFTIALDNPAHMKTKIS